MSDSCPHMRVMIVDDHPTFCMGVRSVVRKMEGYKVCAEANTAADALNALRNESPHILVMDISLPDGNGLDLISQIRASQPDVNILIVSMHEDCGVAIKALRSGAAGYLRKDDGLVELAVAIQQIAQGGTYISPHLRHHRVLSLWGSGGNSPSWLKQLSIRQRDVFYCLGKGMNRGEVASTLGLSVKTVETHRASIKQKLGLTSISETVKLAQDWCAAGDN